MVRGQGTIARSRAEFHQVESICMCGYFTSNADLPSANPPLSQTCEVTTPSNLELYVSPDGSISLDVKTDDDTIRAQCGSLGCKWRSCLAEMSQ
jgi:hypothetical protein